METRKVVALVQIEVIENHSQGYISGRIRPLGLTAYGESPKGAMKSAKRMFNAFVRAHRENNTLKQRLDHSGVEWYWLDEYPKDKPEYEDTDDLNEAASFTSPNPHAFPMAA